MKEVDLDEEFNKCCENYIFDDEWEEYTAKHFFELGLKAQKGEQVMKANTPIDFFSVYSEEEVAEIDKRIERSQKEYDAKLRDKMMKAKDFPMTD